MADADALLEAVLKDVVEAMRSGRSVLVHAAAQGHGDVLRFLVQRINDKEPPEPSSQQQQPELSKALSAAFPGATDAAPQPGCSALLETCATFLSSEGLKDVRNGVLDEALLSALQQWDPMLDRSSPHTQSLERLHAQGAMLPDHATEAERAKHRLFIQDVGARALVADRTNEAVDGPAFKKRKAGSEAE